MSNPDNDSQSSTESPVTKELRFYYVSMRWSLRRIAAETTLSYETIRKRLKEAGITRRPVGGWAIPPDKRFKLHEIEQKEILRRYAENKPTDETNHSWFSQIAKEYNVSLSTIRRLIKRGNNE